MKKYISIMLLIFLSFFILLNFSNIAISDTNGKNNLYVGGTGEGNYSSIKEAINIALNGTSIYVYNGSYFENISINKSINIIGENNEHTIIHGQFNILKIKADYTTINGLKIKCFLNKSQVEKKYIGIEFIDANYCEIKNCIITNLQNGLYFTNSKNNIVENNTISNNTQAINLSDSCKKNIIFHNNFLNNSQKSFDEGNNSWFHFNQGNYWDDYNGLDKNNDGIGEKSYLIDGGENLDKYPLMMPYYGKLRLKDFYVDFDSLYKMLIIGLVVAVLFCLPIAYYWYRKYYKEK